MDRGLAPNLRIAFPPPGFFLADARLVITVDGASVYDGSFKQGVDLLVPVAPGVHAVETLIDVGGITRRRHYSVTVSPGRGVTLALAYSRFWGNFASKPKLVEH
ncbi:MAG: hypothetical protein KF819_00845 [Labilithrix sp.]|nr:hypothetical protein [Labilithrix sp.]